MSKYGLLSCILILFSSASSIYPQCLPYYVFSGEKGSAWFGWSVASAGDVNNDGFDDVIVGAPRNDVGGGNAGRAYVFSGLNGDTLYVFTGETGNNRFGQSVASAGDVNNDGYADLIIGAFRNSVNGRLSGRAYVFSGIDGDTLHVFTGASADNWLGWSVASAGDVNADGYDDLIVGSLREGVFVYSGFSGDTLFAFNGEGAFGWSVATAGDVNNDGYSDLIVGTLRNAIVFSGLNGDTLYVFTGEQRNFGYSVASAGDVNNDGYADLIVGTPWNDFFGTNSGSAIVYSGLNGDTLHLFNNVGAQFEGTPVASAGDVNGDGYDDLIVGAVVITGKAYVFSGKDGSPLYLFMAEKGSELDVFGHSVATAGDINNDGFADLIIGDYASSFVDEGRLSGRAYVYLGGDFMCGDLNNDGIVT